LSLSTRPIYEASPASAAEAWKLALTGCLRAAVCGPVERNWDYYVSGKQAALGENHLHPSCTQQGKTR
jgi:hypothetical protein